MRDVNYGWLLRYAHANGASFFFICVFIHIGRGLYYGSYSKPRLGLWTVGVIIYLLMVIIAFLGYLHSLIWYNFLSNFLSNLFIHPIGLLLFTSLPLSTIQNLKNDEKLLRLAVKEYKDLHLVTTQLLIKNENKNKSAIYCVLNSITGHKYIGSASTNRINSRFRSHCINYSGNKRLKEAIKEYGLENFKFLILEYVPILVLKENLKKSHLALLHLEQSYLNLYSPEYNILQLTTSSIGYTHSNETRLKMKENYSEERKIRIGNLNKKKIYTEEEKQSLSLSAYNRYLTQPDLKKRLARIASKPVVLLTKDEKIHSKFSSIREMAKNFNCCHKTINKHLLNNKIFKEIGYIKYDKKTN